MATKTLLTIEQFDELPNMEGILYELNEGKLVTISEPMPRHNWVRDNVARHQRQNLEQLKKQRDNSRVQATLESLGNAAATDANLMPYILESVRAYATVGEICDVLRKVFGTYTEPAFR